MATQCGLCFPPPTEIERDADSAKNHHAPDRKALEFLGLFRFFDFGPHEIWSGNL
jgi:hypothetical protein